MTTAREVPLGYEVGSGRPIAIPVRHLAICGMTQEAGKTTTLEALIARSGLRAIAFVTKRGEGSFTTAGQIPPYFREQTDWQFVASVLEASRGEKLKFERAWIIRASKGARTLGDVQRNVRKAMETAKGISADVYLTLDAYLEVVVPAIAAVPWAPQITLRPGVNVMNLTAVPLELQHLVIKSALDWVLVYERETVVVIPEAWKFLPQGRGTPVKLAADALIRQGAGLRNYVWLDSQDLGGIEKSVLRHVPVWVLGVQREANEIKRTLDNIPAGIAKPSKADIATLQVGQFFACWSTHTVKVYVQPAWMDAGTAEHVATGAVSIDQVIRQQASIAKDATAVARRLGVQQETTVTDAEARALRDDNHQLRTENAELRRRLEALEKGHRGEQEGSAAGAEASHRNRPLARQRDANDVAAPRRADVRAATDRAPALPARTFSVEESLDNEALYQAFKARLLEEAQTDPLILLVLTVRPELEVEVTPRRAVVDGGTVKGRVARLMAAGWFTEAMRETGTVRRELARTGPDPGGGGALGILLANFVKDGFLVREGSGFRLAPSVKVTERHLEAA